MHTLLALPKRLFYWCLLASDDGAGRAKHHAAVTGFDTWMTTGLMLMLLSPISLAALLALWLAPTLTPYGVDGPTVFFVAWFGPAGFFLLGAVVRGTLYRRKDLPLTQLGAPTVQILVRPTWAGHTWTWTLVAARFTRYGSQRHSADVLAQGSHARMVALLHAAGSDTVGAGFEGVQVSP